MTGEAATLTLYGGVRKLHSECGWGITLLQKGGVAGHFDVIVSGVGFSALAFHKR